MRPHHRLVRSTIVVGATLALMATACSSPGSDSTSEAIDQDPMTTVNASLEFTSDGTERDGLRWLEESTQTARWEFADFPDDLTDLVLDAAAVVETDAAAGGTVTVGLTYGQGKTALGSVELDLPVTGPARDDQVFASGSFTIAEADLPDDLATLWVAATGSESTPIGVAAESMLFQPLRLTPGIDQGDAIPAAIAEASAAETTGTSESPGLASAPSPTTSPAPAPTPVSGSFTTNGDSISGWYWLRDSAGGHYARWDFATVPAAGSSVVVTFSMLATDRVSGGPGVDARFYLTWGFTGADGAAVGTSSTRLVTLENVSPLGAAVGYTCEGSESLAIDQVPSGATGFWVQATRVDPTGAASAVSEHVAFNATAATLSSEPGGGGTTDGEDGTDGDTGSCATDEIATASFTSSGKATGRVAGTHPGWYWLPADSSHPRKQSGTWLFTTRPASSGRILISVPVEAPAGSTATPTAAAFVTYGVVNPDAGSGVQETVRVDLVTTATFGTLTGYSGAAEIVLPDADLDEAVSGYWVRLSLGDPLATRPSVTTAGLGVAQPSVTVCPDTSATTALTGGTGTQAAVTASLDAQDRAIDASASIFGDPATDPDGDGLNQDFEDAAIKLANPVIQVDEEEMWLHYFDEYPTVNFAEATLWPSLADPQYVVIGFLNAWAYDAGGGVQQPANVVFEDHRGDSERIFTAWRVVDDQRIELEWVNTSAHHSYTDHSGVWNVNHQQCNVANTALVKIDAPFSAEYGFTEVMCDVLEFTDDGHLLIYTSANKHAMYPGNGLCNSVSLGRSANGTSVLGENCGWDPGWLGDQWENSDFDGDDEYIEDGRWLFNAYNVGEPGYPLIDDLDNSVGWQRVSEAETQALVGLFMGEAVWSGRQEDNDECRGSTCFCGGFDEGDEIALDWRDDPEMPVDCSGRLGTKYEEWDPIFERALASVYRVTLRTGDVDGAGTDERIVIDLLDASDMSIAAKGYEGGLERGHTDVVYVPSREWTNSGTLVMPAEVAAVRITRTTGNDDRNPRWYLADVKVENLATGSSKTFTANTWINAGRYNGWHSN